MRRQIDSFDARLTHALEHPIADVRLIQQGRLVWATTAICVYVIGSLVMTLLGLATVVLLKRM